MKDEIVRLLGIANPTLEEKSMLLQYLNDADEAELEGMRDSYFVEGTNDTPLVNSELSAKMLRNIHEKIGHAEEIKKPAPVRRMSFLRVAAAACIIGIIGSIVYFSVTKRDQQVVAKNDNNDTHKIVALADSNKALLTLSDGSVIVLDSAKNGKLAQQGNSSLVKNDGKLLSFGGVDTVGKKIAYNTVSTLNGGQYQVVLPDGTQVWLNAASSLRFPTAFTGKKRTVDITGEAYFEVTKNKAMPFVVNVNGAQVEVLGTHFDIMAYADEPVLKTTLLEGSVKFIYDGKFNMLKPGQQSQLSKKDNRVKVADNVDMENVMAWKNGLFRFRGEDLAAVLRQLSRWYDVQIVYNGKVDDMFYAEMPRTTNLSDALQALELTGKVHFKLDGKKIIVSP